MQLGQECLRNVVGMQGFCSRFYWWTATLHCHILYWWTGPDPMYMVDVNYESIWSWPISENFSAILLSVLDLNGPQQMVKVSGVISTMTLLLLPYCRILPCSSVEYADTWLTDMFNVQKSFLPHVFLTSSILLQSCALAFHQICLPVGRAYVVEWRQSDINCWSTIWTIRKIIFFLGLCKGREQWILVNDHGTIVAFYLVRECWNQELSRFEQLTHIQTLLKKHCYVW